MEFVHISQAFVQRVCFYELALLCEALFDSSHEFILSTFIYVIGLFCSITVYTVQLDVLTEESGSLFLLFQVKM